MSLGVKVSSIHGVPSRPKLHLFIIFRGAERMVNEENGQYKETQWSIGRALDQTESLTLILRDHRKRPSGSVTVNLTSLLTQPIISFNEDLVDRNRRKTNMRMAFTLTYQSAGGAVGQLAEDNFAETYSIASNEDEPSQQVMNAKAEDLFFEALIDKPDDQSNYSQITGSQPEDYDLQMMERIDANMFDAESFQVNVSIWKAAQLVGTNINPEFRVTCIGKTYKTLPKMSTNAPYYNDSFKFRACKRRNDMMDQTIHIQCYSVHSNPMARLFFNQLIGEFKIDCGFVYEQKDHSIVRKWALLINPKDPLSGSRGYVQVTISVAARGETVCKDFGYVKDEADVIEGNIIKPRDLDSMTGRKMTDVTVKIYRAEDLPPMLSKGLANLVKKAINEYAKPCNSLVEVTFGGSTEKTSTQEFTFNPEWNQEIVFTDFFPPLTTLMRIKVKNFRLVEDESISTFTIDLKDISATGDGGFQPTFGPSWVNLYGTPRPYTSEHRKTTGAELNEAAGEGVAYRGRLLMAITTAPNNDTEKTQVQQRSCVPLTEVAAGSQCHFLLYGAIFEANTIDQKIGSRGKEISFELSIGNYGNKLDGATGGDIANGLGALSASQMANVVNWYDSVSPATKPETDEANPYYYMNFGARKPSIYTLCYFEDHPLRMRVPNILEKLRHFLVEGMRKVRHLLEKDNQVAAEIRFKLLIRAVKERVDEALSNIRLYKRRRESPLTRLDSMYTLLVINRLRRFRLLIDRNAAKNINFDLGERMREVNSIVTMLSKFIRWHALPDVFINMIIDDERIAYCRIPARDVFYSATEAENGKWAGRVATFYLKKPGVSGLGESAYSIQCQLKIYLWLGAIKDLPTVFAGLPEGYSESCIPSGDLPKEIVYTDESLFELRAYIFMGKHLLAADNTGLSDPIARVLIGNTVIQSQCAYETRSPLWDVMLIASDVRFYNRAVSVKQMFLQVVVELFDVDTTDREKASRENFMNCDLEFMGRAFCKPHVFIEGDVYQPPKLRWWNVFRGTTYGGQILAAFDLVQADTRRPLQNLPTREEVLNFTEEFTERVLLRDVEGFLTYDHMESCDELDELAQGSEFTGSEATQPLAGQKYTFSKKPKNFGFAPSYLVQERKPEHLRIPLEIRPKLGLFRIEIVFWGLRELAVPSGNFRMDIDLGASRVFSDKIKNYVISPNFDRRIMSVDLLLPMDLRYWPPFSIICDRFDIFNTKNTYGSASLKNPKQYIAIESGNDEESMMVQTITSGYDDGEEDEDDELDDEYFKDENVSNDSANGGDLVEEEENDLADQGNVNVGFEQDGENMEDGLSNEFAEGSNVPIIKPKLNRGKASVAEKPGELPGVAKKVWTQENLPMEEFMECDWWARFYTTLASMTAKLEAVTDDKLQTDGEDTEFEEKLKKIDIDDEENEELSLVDIPGTVEKKKTFLRIFHREKKHLTAKERRERKLRRRRKRRQLLHRAVGGGSKKLFDKEIKYEETSFNTAKVDNSWIEPIQIYGCALEEVPEFNEMESPIRSYALYSGKQADDEIVADKRFVGTFKGNFMFYAIDDDAPPPQLDTELRFFKNIPDTFENMKLIVNIYIIRALELQPSDMSGLANPYLMLQLGKQVRILRDEYKPNTLNPIFGSLTTFECVLPQQTTLYIRVGDRTSIGPDNLIGETKIDLERRFLSPHRATCGLAAKYYTQGYAAWRDMMTPTKILSQMCDQYRLPQPQFNPVLGTVNIGHKRWDADPIVLDEGGKVGKSNEPLALAVLRNPGQLGKSKIPALVPEHIETRALTNVENPGIEMGRLQMWVDIFENIPDELPNPVDISPRAPNQYEVRLIVHNTVDVKLSSASLFSSEKSADIYIKGWIKGIGIDDQRTDTHMRSLTGEGMFNWRFVFQFDYLKYENLLQYHVKKTFSVNPIEVKAPAELTLQVFDAMLLGSDKFIGTFNCPLSRFPRGARDPKACGLHQLSEDCPTLSLFRNRSIRGWWPVVDKEDEEDVVTGKVECEIRLLPQEDADNSPVGLGRDEPEPLASPNRPDSSFFGFFGPLSMIIRLIQTRWKPCLIKLLIIALLLLILGLFIYSVPGAAVNRIFTAF